MKILFIHKFSGFHEPLGIMYLSSFLKKHGHDCYFIDVKFENNFSKKIQEISPDIIAYSIMTGGHKFYQKLNQELKKKIQFFSFFGGPHCTFFPEFIYEEGVDIICRGEGEFPFLELVTNLKKKKNITKIKNLWIKLNGKIYKNEVRNLIENLDMLPFPDRELIHKYKRYKNFYKKDILTGRGCPYNCTYCFNHSYNKLYKKKGRIIRKRTVGNVIKELKSIKKTYRPKKFHFVDDNFTLDYKWTLDFCNAYKKERINIPFVIHSRIDLVNEEIVKALKDAGCVIVVYAIESGNEHIRNDILKRNMSEKQIIDGGALLNKYGIRTHVQNMVGLPDETLDMVFETMTLNIKCKSSFPWVSIFQPYPKTDLYKYCKGKGYTFDIDSFGESYHYRSVLRKKDIKKMERLHHLFSLGVAFPILVPFIKILIKLPLTKFYLLLWYFHRGWHYVIKSKWVSLSNLFVKK